MNANVELIIDFLRYRELIINGFKKKDIQKNTLNQNQIFDKANKNFNKIFLDLDNAIKSKNKEKIDLNESNKKLSFFDHKKDIDIIDKAIRFNGIKLKFFECLKSSFTILKILDLKLNADLSKGEFLKLVALLDYKKNIFYYNLAYKLYLIIFFSKDKNKDLIFIEIIEELLTIEVLNICTHFGVDYFKIHGFNSDFYSKNFGDSLLKNFIVKNKESNSKNLNEYDSFIINVDNRKILKLQFQVIEMLRRLLVDFDDNNERKVAHYTTYSVGKRLAINDTSLRLNSTDFMNDPTEGKILQQYLQLGDYEYDAHNKTFLSCFTFNHNSLNQFRLYGLEDEVPCSGISLVYGANFFFNFQSIVQDYLLDNSLLDNRKLDYVTEGLKIPLFRCIYFDSFTGYFEIAKRNKYTFYQEYQNENIASKEWRNYNIKMNNIEKNIKKSLNGILKATKDIRGKEHNFSVDQLKNINKILKPIFYLVKHFSFQEEQECRMIVIDKIDSENVIMDNDNTSRSYVEYDQPTHKNLKNIYIGVASSNKMIELLKTIKGKSINCPKTMVSNNPYRVG